MPDDPLLKRCSDIAAGEGKAWLYQHRFATPLIDDRQQPNPASIKQLIMHEVHAQALVRRTRHWHRTPVDAHVLAPSQSSAQLQAFQAVESVDPFVIDNPAFSAQQYMNTQVTKAWTR